MTSKDYLSQEEIDALLKISSDGPSAEEAETPSIEQYLNPIETDALGEIGNITFGSAATALSTLLGKKVEITTPRITLLKRENLENEFPKPHVAVHVRYVEGFEGVNSLVIKTSDAQVIADLMLGGDGTNHNQELNEIHISAVQEAMNQMMGSSATSMSTIFNRMVNISPPGIGILNMSNGQGVETLPDDNVLVKVSFRLTISDLIDSTIMQILTVPFAQNMVRMLMGDAAEATAGAADAAASAAQVEPDMPMAPPAHPASHAAPEAAAPQQMAGYDHPMMGGGHVMQQPYGAAPMPSGNMEAHGGNASAFGATHQRNLNVQPVQFANFQPAPYVQNDESNLNLLLDIPLKVTVELGRTHKQIKDILELSQGSIIELDKLAGEPVDILVNNKLIAKGEVVVIDENFGVRVTDIINQWDRIQKLQ
ncbi:flagellar motor switch phosphatase FliY [Paenibacillus apiarius]|uniref:Flagellar motor switch phosphatase FliY n=1 Tax=Paenibacillus apiarius TaxID=46240 RepID=A0ABT4DLZ0_9BACL|nr:flagellar motor switch phosphatase FliY [Paenibacillus apiarius]MCY9516165.1 flagellar motor switch phosphatase FliY [Paenibacillus apiarius]MCY9518376.1 flagellar motor switch phosphatase FliY [Paenibacillus apiarius]MCY9551223.1 flagellar motor switch phosphatase FliY [Paenibacillus apiarius]MCY9558377.1 flagellar motor switch phosphatase FliY [Paenibacillus apiarius]MCY9684777.1 flagellar motor switch phosphatase FliY [Paenibacillus apiarius]